LRSFVGSLKLGALSRVDDGGALVFASEAEMSATRAGAPNEHPIMILAFLVLAAAALAPVIYLALSPDTDPVQVYLGPSHGGPAEGPAPNNDPQQAAMTQPATIAPAEPVMTVEAARHLKPMPSLALNQSPIRAEPEPAASDLIAQQIVATQAVAPSVPMPSFVATDTPLYAKGNTRLRAAPSTTADVLTKLPADAPLRATARSTDGAWWRVSLAGGRIAYVNQAVVSQTRVVKAQPQQQATTASAPVTTAASRPVEAQPEWKRQSQEFFGYVDKSMSWLADQAGGGPAPKVVRSER
jgi:SH3-like domain-containing protein